MTSQIIQALSPVLVLLAWQALAGLLGFVLSHWKNVEAYVARRPWLAFTVQILRALGLDLKKVVGATKELAEARAAFKPKGD